MPSSVIEWMRYEPGRRSLLIAYRGQRGVYRYFDVDAGEWDAFVEAKSKGTYLNRAFKPRMHPFLKLPEPAPMLRRGRQRTRERLCWPAPERSAPGTDSEDA